jgi:pimeloyl-ACP methyl ester carboxylesterase
MKMKIMIAALLGAALSVQAGAGELLKLPSREGVTQTAFLEAPSATPSWVVVLFAGDDGAVALTDNGPTRMLGNFLVRTAAYWREVGEATAVFDAPSDNAAGMRDTFRLGKDATQDVEAVVQALRQRYPAAHIALVGTSRGTITVGNVLKRNPGIADAFVLTSPVTVSHKGNSGLSGLDWEGNKARVLVLSNDNDACFVSPFSGAKRMAQRNGFDFVAVSSSQGGGDQKSDCGAKSPHGFLGIERQVLDDIHDWLNGKPVAEK